MGTITFGLIPWRILRRHRVPADRPTFTLPLSSFASSGGILRGSLFSPYYDTLQERPHAEFISSAVGAGFLLIELLVVIAIIAILIGLSCSAVQKEAMRGRCPCSEQQSQNDYPWHINCADTNQENLPPSIGLYPSLNPVPYNGDGGLFLYVLPYIEQGNLYNASLIASGDGNDNRNGTYPTYSQWTATPSRTLSSTTYICPSDSTQPNQPRVPVTASTDRFSSTPSNAPTAVIRRPSRTAPPTPSSSPRNSPRRSTVPAAATTTGTITGPIGGRSSHPPTAPADRPGGAIPEQLHGEPFHLRRQPRQHPPHRQH